MGNSASVRTKAAAGQRLVNETSHPCLLMGVECVSMRSDLIDFLLGGQGVAAVRKIRFWLPTLTSRGFRALSSSRIRVDYYMSATPHRSRSGPSNPVKTKDLLLSLQLLVLACLCPLLVGFIQKEFCSLLVGGQCLARNRRTLPVSRPARYD
jgi:hypothetical protein